jgi:hypothetical protein
VPGLVAEEHHDRPGVLDVADLLFLEAGETRVGQIEGDADDRGPVRAAPDVGQVDLGLETEPLPLHFPAQTGDMALEGRALDRQAQAGDTRFQELEPDGFPALDQGPDALAAHGRVRT